MNLRYPHWRSLKTRVTVVALAVFVLGVWSLAFYASRVLHDDLEELLSKQQFSTVTIVSAVINREFVERIDALARVAEKITPAHMAAPHSLQTLFDNQPLLHELFNAGTFVTGVDGTAIASVPASLKRVGVNYLDRSYIVAALTQGRSSVSEPLMGKRVGGPVLSIATPIRDTKGAVVGALAGVVDLSQPNFLDLILGERYGNGSGYILVDPEHRRVVTATDKGLNFQSLRPPGVSLIADRYADGYEGYGIFVDAQGVEHLSAAHSVPAPGWYLAALLPAEVAFAPIHAMRWRLLSAAAALTVLAGILMWWMLSRELAPLLSTAGTLAALRVSDQFPSPLPIARHDEIGHLVVGFNHMLDSLRARDLSLRESEARLMDAQTIAGLGSYVLSGDSGMWTSSAVLDRLLGIDETFVHSVQGWVNLIHPEDRQRMSDYFSGLVKSHSRQFDNTYRVLRLSDGELRWMHGVGILEFDSSGRFLKMHGSVQDITQSVLVQQRLSTLSRITEQAPIAIVITDMKGDIEYVNPHFEKVSGYTLREVIGKNPRLLQSGHTAAAVYSDLWDSLKSGRAWQGEFQNRKKNGERFVERAVIAPILNAGGVATHYVALKEDVTEREDNRLQLQASLQETTALLNEVHHRVKNNLQVIASLLRLEASRAGEPATRAVLAEMQGRIRSMALVHETLYQSGSFAAVDLKSYIQQVASLAFRAQAGSGSGVRLALELVPIRVSMDLATPCGLLVNELICNSIKHGFPGGQLGEVRVKLHPVEDGSAVPTRWRLQVRDDGVGLPADFETRRRHSLGLQLVADFANQLGGELTIESDQGVSFSVTFPV
ncbi:MAG: histidine kinase dimerization/phosphoacceptor domain -containing protein [Rhodoferax sp.]